MQVLLRKLDAQKVRLSVVRHSPRHYCILQQFLVLESDGAVAGDLLFPLFAVDLDIVVAVPLGAIALSAHTSDFLNRVSLIFSGYNL